MADKERTVAYKVTLDSSGVKAGRKAVVDELQGLHAEVTKITGKIRKRIVDAFEPIEKIGVKLGTVATHAERNFGRIESSISQFSNRTKEAGTDVDAFNKKITSMSTRTNNLNTRLIKSRDTMRQFSTASREVVVGNVSASTSSSAFANSLKLVNGQFDVATRVVRTFKNDIMDLVRINVMAGAAIVAAFGVPGKVFGDFQKELLTLKNLANDFTQQELKQFSDQAKQLAVEVGDLAQNLTKSGIEMVRLGLSARETNIALRSVADASLANSINIDRAAEISIGTLRAMGLEIGELDRVLNVMTRSAVQSATDFQSLSDTFKFAAPVARSAGAEIEELAAATSILSNNMIKGSQAGTTLRRMFTVLQKPTGKARELLKLMNIEIQDTTTGKMRPLLDITQDLSRAMEGFSTTTKNATVSTIFGQYALSGSLALINSSTEEINKMRNAMENQAITNKKMADGMRQGVNYEFRKFIAEMNNAGIVLGEALAPVMIEFLQTAQDLAHAVSELDDLTLATIASMAKWGSIALVTVTALTSVVLAVRTLYGAIITLKGVILASAAWKFMSAVFLEIKTGAFAASHSIDYMTGAVIRNRSATMTLLVGLGKLAAILAVVGAAIYANWKLYKMESEALENQNKILDMHIAKQKQLIEARRLARSEDAKNAKVQATKPYEKSELVLDLLDKGKKYADGKNAPKALLYQDLARAQQRSEQANAKLNDLRHQIMTVQGEMRKHKKDSDMYKQQEDILKRLTSSFKQQADIVIGGNQLLIMHNVLTSDNLQTLQTINTTLNSEKMTIGKDEQAVLDVLSANEDRAKSTQVTAGLQEELNKMISNELEAGKKRAAEARKKAPPEEPFKMLSVFEAVKGGYKGQSKHMVFRADRARGKGAHQGEDIGGPYGADILAREAGKVAWVDHSNRSGYGRGVLIDHGKGVYSFYAHGSKVYAKVGQEVKKGEAIMALGGSGMGVDRKTRLPNGRVIGYDPHLHTEIRTGMEEGLTGAAARQAFQRAPARPPKGDYSGTRGQRINYELIEEKKAINNILLNLQAKYNAAATKADKDHIQSLITAQKKKLEDLDKNFAGQEAKRIERLEKSLAKDIEKMGKEISDIEAKRLQVIADREKEGLSQRVNNINAAHLQEMALINEKYHELEKVNELMTLSEKKKNAQLALLTEEQLSKSKEAYEKDEMAWKEHIEGRIAAEKAVLAKEIEDQKATVGSLSAIDSPEATEYEKKRLAIMQKRMELLNQIGDIENTIADMNSAQLEYEKESLKLSELVEFGAISKARADKLSIDYLNGQISRQKEIVRVYEQGIAKGIIGGPDARQKLEDSERKLNELLQQRSEIIRKTAEWELKVLDAKRDRKDIGKQEYQQGRLQTLNKWLQENDKLAEGYNEKLEQRNDLLMITTARQGDMVGLAEALILRFNNLENLAEGTDFSIGDAKVGLDEMFSVVTSMIAPLADMAGLFFNIDEGTEKILGNVLGIGVGIAETAVGAVNGDFTTAMKGLGDIIGGVIGLFTELSIQEQENIEVNRELALSLGEIEDRAKIAQIRIKELKGELSGWAADAARDNVEIGAKKRTLEALKEERDGRGANSLAARVARGDASIKEINRLKEINAEISTLISEIDASEIERKKNAVRDWSEGVFSQAVYEAEVNAETMKQQGALLGSMYEKRRAEILTFLNKMSQDYENALDKGWDMKKFEVTQTQEFQNFMNSLNEKYAGEYNEHNEELKKIDFDKREHDIYMMEDSFARELERIKLKKDIALEELRIEKESETDPAKKAEIQDKIDRLKLRGIKDLNDAWKEFNKTLSDDGAKAQELLTNDPMIKLANQRTKAYEDARKAFDYATLNLDLIGDPAERARVAAEANKIYKDSINLAERNYLLGEQNVLFDATDKALEVEAMKAEAREEGFRKADIDRNRELNSINKWYNEQITLANGNKEKLALIDEEYITRKEQALKNHRDAVIAFAREEFDELQQLRDAAFELDRRGYDNRILNYQRNIEDLQSEQRELREQIEYYDALIEKKRREFEDEDTTLWGNRLKNVDLPPEIRKGLEAIANPEGVPNSRFHRETQMKAIQEHIELLEMQNESMMLLEQRDKPAYYEESSRIALIQGKMAADILNDQLKLEKMTRREEEEVRHSLAEAYVKFQEAEMKLREVSYDEEKKQINDSIRENEEKQRKKQKSLDSEQDKLRDLTRQYEDDSLLITEALFNIENGHDSWIAKLQEVRENWNDLVQDIVSGARDAGLDIGSGDSVSGYSNVDRIKGDVAKGEYVVVGGDGYLYKRTSDMYAAQGLAKGGMFTIPKGFNGDNFPIMPGVNANAGELVTVSPLNKLREVIGMNAGTTLKVDIYGNTFHDEVDFERVFAKHLREREQKRGVRHGTYSSNLGGR